MAAAEVGDEQRFARPDDQRTPGAGRRPPRPRQSGVPPDRHHVQPHRHRGPHHSGRVAPARRPRTRPAFRDVGSGRRERLCHRDDPRRARSIHRRPTRGSALAREPVRATDVVAVPRADPQLRRRRRVAARAVRRRRAESTRPRHGRPHRRRTADERCRRHRGECRRLGPPGRLDLDRLHQGTRRSDRRRARRIRALHRRRVALQAPIRRRDAPGRYRRGRVPACARPPCRPSGRRPLERHNAGGGTPRARLRGGRT